MLQQERKRVRKMPAYECTVFENLPQHGNRKPVLFTHVPCMRGRRIVRVPHPSSTTHAWRLPGSYIQVQIDRPMMRQGESRETRKQDLVLQRPLTATTEYFESVIKQHKVKAQSCHQHHCLTAERSSPSRWAAATRTSTVLNGAGAFGLACACPVESSAQDGGECVEHGTDQPVKALRPRASKEAKQSRQAFVGRSHVWLAFMSVSL
ncbi:hypothetical protein J3F83DRAFT_752110 [Trichoderma novae-zelandiae]